MINKKNVILSIGGFGVAVAAVITAQAIYTHTKIGVDKKALIASSTIGVVASYLIMQGVKK